MARTILAGAAALVLASSVAASACSSSSETTTPVTPNDTPDAAPVTPTPTTPDAGEDSGPPEPDPLEACTKDPGPIAPTFDAASATDPIGAENFTLQMALAGLPDGPGKLTAAIKTDRSSIVCTLDEAAAPISVANFVGLARGTRPYKLASTWEVGRFYDGLTFHRVIPDFVIQGGDPDGVGTGGPGYSIPEENHVDEPLGTLAMAASNKPSGSQFYIVVGQGPAPNYNVFGSCTTEVAVQIANVPRDGNDRPETPVVIRRIDIARCP